MNLSEAVAILTDWCGKKPSSMTQEKAPRAEARLRSWWEDNNPAKTPANTLRSKAYLMAYLEIAGERMPVDGLPLSDGFLYLDRGVMGGMLYGGYVSWESQDGAPYFKLTAKGRRLLLPILS